MNILVIIINNSNNNNNNQGIKRKVFQLTKLKHLSQNKCPPFSNMQLRKIHANIKLPSTHPSKTLSTSIIKHRPIAPDMFLDRENPTTQVLLLFLIATSSALSFQI